MYKISFIMNVIEVKEKKVLQVELVNNKVTRNMKNNILNNHWSPVK